MIMYTPIFIALHYSPLVKDMVKHIMPIHLQGLLQNLHEYNVCFYFYQPRFLVQATKTKIGFSEQKDALQPTRLPVYILCYPPPLSVSHSERQPGKQNTPLVSVGDGRRFSAAHIELAVKTQPDSRREGNIETKAAFAHLNTLYCHIRVHLLNEKTINTRVFSSYN